MSSISTSGDQIEQKAMTLLNVQLPARITTAEEYQRVAEGAKAVTALLKENDLHHDPIIASANTTHKLALAAKAKIEGPLLRWKQIAARLIGTYQDEQRRKAAEEERKKREAAAKVERERQEQEAAEARRVAAEKAAEEERARNDAEAARQLAAEAFDKFDGQAAEELQREAEAHEAVAERAEMEKQEADRLATEIATAPVVVPAVRVEPDIPKVEGVSGRVTWEAEIVNKRRFLESILENFRTMENSVPWEAFMPPLNSIARGVKKEIEIAPGVWARPRHGGAFKG